MKALFKDKLLYLNKISLSKPLCEELISLFEKSSYTYPGETFGGLTPQVKNTTDLIISSINDPSWCAINKTLVCELTYNIREYINSLSILCDSSYDILNSHSLIVNSMQMQKYDVDTGKYEYHNDYSCEFDTKQMRQITFLWYINDVTVGGETEFGNNTKVVPEEGKLVLFPAHWTFPHKAHTPISNAKYIITGWAYEQY